MWSVRLRPGDDLKRSLEQSVRERDATGAYVATCVGSLRYAAIRFAGGAAAERVDGPLEIVSLVGTFAPEGAQLHVAVADASGRTLGGFLAEGTPVLSAEVVIGVLPGPAGPHGPWDPG